MAYSPLDELHDSAMYRFCVCILIALFSPFVSTRAVPRAYPGLNTTLLRLVHDNAVNSSTQRYVARPSASPTGAHPIVPQSWEIGTLAEALTEAKWPQLSVFQSGSLPPPVILPWWENANDVLAIAET